MRKLKKYTTCGSRLTAICTVILIILLLLDNSSLNVKQNKFALSCIASGSHPDWSKKTQPRSN